MSEKYFLIECVTGLHKVIKQSLQQTQRIKFTCFDVSSKYITFGATSGGVYIFNRQPCEFLKLVPSKEGAITHIVISPDEKSVVVTTSRGFVILIENCFDESKVQYQLFSEHRGYVVTALRWHYNDIYCGDNAGKVSVITITNNLSKAIFQPPCAILMHLDSGIVQLDTYSKYLLVSTRKKTFLCDTEEEQYRQIGKKLRDGDFGACFYTDNPTYRVDFRHKEKTIFRILKEDEKFSNADVENVKIYCTRPGLRMWEANFETNVVCTYQFKDTIKQATDEILQLRQEENARLKVVKGGVEKDNVNFGRIIVLSNRFLLTFTSSNLFVFDAKAVNVIFRYGLMENTKDVKVIENSLYVWDRKELKVLAVMDLEMLILKTLARKQYYICAEICLKYTEDLVKLLEVSHRIQSLVILKEKLIDDDIREELFPLLKRIKEIKTHTNGIVKVENGHIPEAACSSFNEATPANNANETDPARDPNFVLNTLYKQYQVNKMYSRIEIPQIYELLSVKDLDEIVVIFRSFIEHVKAMCEDDNNVRLWCYNQYLKYVARNYSVRDLETDSVALEFIFEAFKSINSNNARLLCECDFPLPAVKNFRAEFYDVGCDICSRLSDDGLRSFRKSVPYMWMHSVSEPTVDVGAVLPLLVQFSDDQLFGSVSRKFGNDSWEDAVRLMIKLKSNVCLNCDKKVEFDVNDTIRWKYFGAAMVENMGAFATVGLLQRYAKHIPNSELGPEFYQMCIFTTVTKGSKDACNFLEDPYKFNNDLKKYLIDRHVGLKKTKEFNKANPKCSSCDLPIKIAVQEDGVTLTCGHDFHNICLETLNKVCCICDVKGEI